MANGYHNGYEKQRHSQKSGTTKESFEEVPLITACLTYLGFYVLMIIGYVNQLFVKPNLESEKHRDVSVLTEISATNENR